MATDRNYLRQTDAFTIGRVQNLTNSAEGPNLPPRLQGNTRVPVVTEFKVLTRAGFLGGTEFVLYFLQPPGTLKISTYNILYKAEGASSFSSAGSSATSPVTIRIPIADPVNVVFKCQTNLGNGFISDINISPSCTSRTIRTTITPGDITGLDLIFGGAAMTPPGAVPFVDAPGILTTDAQLNFDPSTKSFGVGGMALTSKLITDGTIGFGVDPTVHSSDFTVGDYWFTPVDTSGGTVVVTLPPALSLSGRWHVFKKVTGDTNDLTVAGDGSDLIDGAATQTITPAYGLLSVVRLDSTNWAII